MFFAASFFALALLTPPTFAAPAPLVHVQRAEEPVDGSYIVLLRNDGPSVSSADVVNTLSSSSQVTNQWSVIKGLAGRFTPEDLEALRSHPDVLSIQENGIVRTTVTQTDAPWGLERISSRSPVAEKNVTALNFTYSYDERAGAGADVYVIDTGIFISHPAFDGRASWGTTFGGYPDEDDSGHGTHCAGTIASGPYGVAKAANVIAVKVLNSRGAGTWADVISGIDWVAATASQRGRPSVASLSFSGGNNTAVDQAVANLVSSGVATAVAAGNSARNSSLYSPARVLSVVTVAASDINDYLATFSNYGSIVDIIAPGVDVISTWNDGGTNMLSGTSMSTPHVSGLIAYFLSIDSTLTPDGVSGTLSSYATTGAITLSPAATTAGTPNKLAFNGFSTKKLGAKTHK